MRKSTIASVLAAFMVTLSGCDRQPAYDRRILQAEEMSADSTHAAITMLEGRSGELCKNPEDSALYELVYTERLRAHGITIKNNKYIKQCVAFFKKQGDKERQARALLQSAFCLYNTGEYAEATTEMKEVEQLTAGNGNHDLKNRLYEGIGMLNSISGNSGMMMKYYKMSLNEAMLMNNINRTAQALNIIATEYYRLGQTDSFMAYMKRCEPMKEKVEEYNKAAICSNLGNYYLNTGDTAKATEYLTQAWSTDPDRKASLLLGLIYEKQNKTDRSIMMLYDAVSSNSPHIRIKALKHLIEYSEHTKNKEKSLFLIKQLNDIYETNISKETVANINERQNIFDRNSERQDIRKKIMLAGGLTSGLIAVIFLTLYLSDRKMRFIRNTMTQQKQTLAELKDRYVKEQKNAETLKQKLTKYAETQQLAKMWDIEKNLINAECTHKMRKTAAQGKTAGKEEWNEIHMLISNNDRPLCSLLNKSKNLNSNEINTVILTRLRFMPTEIATLTGVSPQTVTNIRARLLNKIFKEKGGAKDFDRRIRNL